MTDAGLLAAAERRRILEEAQQQADTVFAQYQLSQLVALGGELGELGVAVISELVRVSDAVAGALWLAAPNEGRLRLCATEPDALAYPDAVPVPAAFEDAAAAEAWVRPSGWYGVTLDERRAIGAPGGGHAGSTGTRTVGFIALRPPEGESLPADRIRLLALVRHELAIAFRAAQLRETLAGEQALLAAILDGANDGIIAVDEDRRVVRVNRAAWSLLGTPPSAAGGTCRDLLGCATATGGEADPASDRLRCGARCRFEEVLDGPAGIVDAELRLRRDDGTEIPVAASFSAMAGRETGAVVVLRDLRSDLAAEELRASFLAAVSHELRTPLALIGGYVDSLLGLDLDAATQRRSVERIGHAATRLNLLVDELLDLTQLEHASMGLRRTRVHLPDLLASFTHDLGESPGMPQVHVAVPSDLPEVDADALRIGHVLANLVDNARKYGGDGPVTITARRNRGDVVVTVSDTGPGIPVDERTLVFDRFYRGRAARAGEARGSGLGLYVCRRLVEAHGGEIWVEPEAGRSAISFSLPHARHAPGRTQA